MKKIKQLSFVLFIFSVLAFSYPVTQVFAQGGGQCDNSLACNPSSGTCCNNQCDPGPACNPNDPNAIPCCSLEGNDNQHHDQMTHDMGNDDQGHDQMNHDTRDDKRRAKRQKEMHEELREKLNECLQRERNSHQPQPRSSQHTPAPNCSGSVQQATTAIRALDECQANLIAANQQLTSQSSMSSPAPNCTGSAQQATSANQALNEICISLNDRINRLQAQVAALPLASDQNMRNFQQASQIAQNTIIRSFQEEVFDQHCPNPGEQ